ncbi:GH116 family glycosyl hydrolase [Alteromonas sp. KUL17]|uniref:alpha-L-rhamnosidase-related protein n=1 Tax=Alteromonas sp. KUL17 TaxID=2480796 RepID=UPI001F5F783A|nr:GH116 family glycosyl hydrolase [Alteromonas sp. KUL17]
MVYRTVLISLKNHFRLFRTEHPSSASWIFNKNFTPYFDVEADKGKVIRVASNMRLNTIETLYTTKSGRQQFEGYSWSNGRIIEFSIPKGVKVHALKYRWTGVGKTPGYFESDDAWLNRIWQMAENTLYICARDNFMDTPDRERGLWIGDVADQASYLFYSMDQAGRDLLKKAIKVTLAFSDTESGIFAGLGPGRFRELPAQSLQFIKQGIWHYYYNTGDVETLSYAYPFVHKYLLLWDIKQNGLPTFRTGDWKWTDWGPQETIDYDVIQTALYYSALVAARKMASELDRDENLAFYNARIESIRLAFQKEFWQNGYFSSDKMFKDDRANAVAILFDLALPTQFQQIVDNVLLPNHYASPHFEWMIYNAMAKAGRYKDAIARMKERYGPQVDNPELSTLAEYLPARGTENHAWNAPSTVLSKHIAGVKPTSVAWKSYEVMPNLAHLTKVSQLIPSVKGDILFKLEFDNDTLNIVLNSPAKTTAKIGVPKILTQTSQILFNGKEVWSNGSERNEIPGIKFVEESNDYFIFSVKPGKWDILAR